MASTRRKRSAARRKRIGFSPGSGSVGDTHVADSGVAPRRMADALRESMDAASRS